MDDLTKLNVLLGDPKWFFFEKPKLEKIPSVKIFGLYGYALF